MVLLASLAVAFPPAALIVGVVAGTWWPAWAIAAAVALLVAVAAYLGAVSAAAAFGDVVRASTITAGRCSGSSASPSLAPWTLSGNSGVPSSSSCTSAAPATRQYWS